LDFSVKVVRHKNREFLCGRLWKKNVGLESSLWTDRSRFPNERYGDCSPSRIPSFRFADDTSTITLDWRWARPLLLDVVGKRAADAASTFQNHF
jgi:hypothetical protein